MERTDRPCAVRGLYLTVTSKDVFGRSKVDESEEFDALVDFQVKAVFPHGSAPQVEGMEVIGDEQEEVAYMTKKVWTSFDYFLDSRLARRVAKRMLLSTLASSMEVDSRTLQWLISSIASKGEKLAQESVRRGDKALHLTADVELFYGDGFTLAGL